MNDRNLNPWTSDDEKAHQDSMMEWWCSIAFLESTNENKKWSFKGSLAEWDCKSEKGSVLNTTLYDQKQNKYLTYHNRGNNRKLKCSTENFFAKYDESFMEGKFPNYRIYFVDNDNYISLKLDYHAESYPRWISQDITGGWLPLGMGFYRYGFIPKCKATGTLKIKDKKYNVEGKGYYEHVWGDISYDTPLSNFSNIKKTLSVYSKLIGWWIKNHKPKIPNSLKFANENNPFGYDWVWAILDNGWTVYYGNILFWLMKGPVFGTLIFSKDGKKYEEFCDISFQYNRIKNSKKYDFHYPSEIEVTAKKEDKKIHLVFKQLNKTREYVSKYDSGNFWKCFVICEEPGVVEGFFSEGDKKTPLTGVCKIEPQRQVSVLGHNSLNIDFLKPPKGLGVSFDLDSNFLKKKISTRIQIAPSPRIDFNSRKKKNI